MTVAAKPGATLPIAADAAEQPAPSRTVPRFEEHVTTLMFDVPCRLSEQQTRSALHDMGFKDAYDFLHVPAGRGTINASEANRGFAIVNFLSHAQACAFADVLMDYTFRDSKNSTKTCTARAAHTQGREANILRNLAVLRLAEHVTTVDPCGGGGVQEAHGGGVTMTVAAKPGPTLPIAADAAEQPSPSRTVPRLEEHVTTLMFDVPCRLSEQQTRRALHDMGFKDAYDFLHVPGRRGNTRESNRGFAIVNFLSHAQACAFAEALMDYTFPDSKSTKTFTARAAHTQGREANILLNLTRFEEHVATVDRRANPFFAPLG